MTTPNEIIASQVMTSLGRGTLLTRPLQRKVLTYAKSLMDGDEIALARVLLRILRKMEPYEARFQWLLGLCEFRLGNFGQARANLESHYLQTRRPQTAFMLARLYLVLGDTEQMNDHLKSVPPYERYLVGNAPLFNLLYSAAQPLDDESAPHCFHKMWESLSTGELHDFGPFFNDQEERAVCKLLAKAYWRRGMLRLEATEVDSAISDFSASEFYLNETFTGGNHV